MNYLVLEAQWLSYIDAEPHLNIAVLLLDSQGMLLSMKGLH